LIAVAVGGKGILYAIDSEKSVVLKLDAQGGLPLVYAGNGSSGFSGDGGLATKASLNSPGGVAADGRGNLYIADSDNNRIRKVDKSGVITTVAGDGTAGFSGDGGPATRAQLDSPVGVAVDDQGDLYIGDTSNRCIRKVNADGIITTLAENDDTAYFSVLGIALDARGNVILADASNGRVMKADSNGKVTTVAGVADEYGHDGDGRAAVQAQLNDPRAVAVDLQGNLYITDDFEQRVRKVDVNGIITTFAGTGVPGYAGDGGPANQATLHDPEGVATDAEGNVYIAEDYNRAIRKVDSKGVITTVFGGVTQPSDEGAPAVAVQLYQPDGVTIDAQGDLYLVESEAHRVRKVDPKGIIVTVAGNGESGDSGDGGPADQAQFNEPVGVATDLQGNIFIADRRSQRIREIDASGRITAFAGGGNDSVLGDAGLATQATLRKPVGIATDFQGNVYIADYGDHRVRKVDGNGIITTVAGNGTRGFSGDGGPAIFAKLDGPQEVAADALGNLYIADSDNNRIRKVDGNGIITTVAGNGTQGFSGDGGTATKARLNLPGGLALDGEGDLYIADLGNQRIRKADANGVITTVAGNGTQGFSGDGGPAAQAQLQGLSWLPFGLAIDGANRLYLADSGNNRIRRIIDEELKGSGDLNGDGGVNVQDATLALRIAVGLIAPTVNQRTSGDLNGDGQLNVQDATLILRAAVGLAL
jgi:uncharacterized protein YjiK